jgi:hypothetical protein
LKLDLSKSFDKKKAQTYLDKLIEKQSKIELKEYKEARSNRQNRYFHVICTILADDLGYTVDEMKIEIKRNLEWMMYIKNGKKFLKSSKELDTKEFTDLIDYTRSIGEENGCYLPTPDEYYGNTFEFEKLLL